MEVCTKIALVYVIFHAENIVPFTILRPEYVYISNKSRDWASKYIKELISTQTKVQPVSLPNVTQEFEFNKIRYCIDFSLLFCFYEDDEILTVEFENDIF